MTTLRTEKMILPSANWGGESTLPSVAVHLRLSDITDKMCLEDDEGLFVNYGRVNCAFPYRAQDLYDRALTPREYEAQVLENDSLRAVFMPCFGGKLWSLVDKKNNRELLFRNDVVRPCNLGVRNAWMSGGIEWNAGFMGHGPYTCSPVCTAKSELDDGTPVLRFYYFERIRACVVQMDIFLPDGSDFLFVRTRLLNPGDEVVPMYWWSNVAAAEGDDDRVIVPAEQSYTAPNCDVVKIDIPVHNGIDVTYPGRNITSNDYFWDARKGERPYICHLGADGYGLCETSTSLLRGRKLFVWGNSRGGHKWMNFLTADDKTGRYDEIQCGLARTQYECLPMPPHTAWEFLEAYGAMQADPAKVHGEWSGARREAERILDGRLPAAAMEKLLSDTRAMAKSPARVISAADGWGALEGVRRGEAFMCPHLDFGKTGEEQAVWLNLLRRGTVGAHDPENVPLSYMRQREWLDLLREATRGKDADNWYAWYLLGAADAAEEAFDRAEEELRRSLALAESAWANYVLAVVMRKTARPKEEVSFLFRARELRKGDISLEKELFRCLYEHGLSAETVECFENADECVRQNARCQLYYAFALARSGRAAEAEKILLGEGKCLVVPDVRECELTTSQLWFYLLEVQGKSAEEPPRDLDFRMFTKREGWF